MSFNEIITFEGGLNTDDTPQSMPKGDYRDFSYCRLGYNSGNAFAVVTSKGTVHIINNGITEADKVLGATQWQKTNSIVYFVYKSTSIHEIWSYSIDNQTHTLVVQNSVLNFSRDWPIFHANVIDDILKWTDGRWDAQMYDVDGNRLFNPPYQIDLQKAIDGYYNLVDLRVIDAIKWPMDPPRLEYITDDTRNDNKLRKKLFRFAIQPIYENNEPGVWSMYTSLELPVVSELITGTNFMFLNNDNGIRITFNTGPKIIRKFNLAVQQYDPSLFGAEPPFGVFLELDKSIDGIADGFSYSVVYYGDVSTKPVQNIFQNYDRLPVVADCQEYLPTNQLTYVNFREGYDKIEIDVELDYNVTEIENNPFSAVSFDLNYPPIAGPASFTTDTDEFNANVLFPFSAGMVFWGPSPTSAGYGLLTYQISSGDIAIALAGATIMDQNVAIVQIIGNSFMNQLGYAPGTANPLGNAVSYSFVSLDDNQNGQLDPTIRTTRQTNPRPSLKVGATHRFGIVYGDRAYRDGTVLTNDSMNLFVPWFYDIDRSTFNNPQNPFTVLPRITINHQPPVWATKYWIVAQPATEILSFGHYTVTNAVPYGSAITLDSSVNNRYIIEIDNYYQRKNLGVNIAHQIQKGDRVRFIRQRPEGDQVNMSTFEYLPYIELEVLDFDINGSISDGVPRQRIFVTLFDTGSIEDDFTLSLGNLFGQLIEVYTPRPAVDDNGSLFVSVFKDVYGPMDIINPHTDDRAHDISYQYFVNIDRTDPGDPFFFINNDVTSLLLFSGFRAYVYNPVGAFIEENNVIVSSATYNAKTNRTILTFLGLGVIEPNFGYVTLTIDVPQIFTDGVFFQSAVLNMDYGDVYLRSRNYGTGLAGDSAVYYYIVEDPNYSDYWASNIHQAGRMRVQDPNGKMTHRQATAIHSDSFIVGTQINGLSSFALDNSNVEDMNPIFGGVIRAYMSGREGKTLKCLQPKKENSIYIQFYPNEVGSDSTVRVSNRTFASWFDYKSLLGCSDAGATAILPNGSTIYFDNNTGVFVYSGGNGQMTVSEIDQDTGKDYKFRTKTKQLARSYNSSSEPMVRTYVNESVGEVGFAFRFDVPYSGPAFGAFNPPIDDGEYFRIDGDVEYLYGYDIVISFSELNEGTGNIYSGNINYVFFDEENNYTLIGLDGVTPSIDDYNVEGYYFTTSNINYDHVVFDYVNMKWRSTYDYNFSQFCNLGQTLIGWGADNRLYVHNFDTYLNFHGESFVQKVSFVSNENPLLLKRYQDITLISDDLFLIEAQSEPNRSYPRGMKTTMPTNLISTYEGYGKVNYRKNLYDPRYFDANNISTSSYNPPGQPINGWELDFDQLSISGETITIIQPSDGQIFTGVVTYANYDPLSDRTLIRLTNPVTAEPIEPSTNGVEGSWYLSERALVNGEDIRANAVTHTLTYNPAINDEPSVLFSVGIKGVLS
jgi:hypothetical protein